MAVASNSIRLNELVSMRATVGRDDEGGGDQRDAEDLHGGQDRRGEHHHQHGVDPAVFTPDASATSGSNVVKSSWR